MDDLILLREYAERGSEKAFTTLVDRHLALVFSTALRRLGDPQIAEDITQNVFCLLARKAKRLGPKTVVAGWLHRAVFLATAQHWRTESRRRRREQELTTMISETPASDATWEEIAPHLDEALNSLEEDDRVAVLLRFFQGKPFLEVGLALGVTEDAARMRINRALERLRGSLLRKEIVCATAVLGTLLAGNAIQAVPPSLISANILRQAGVAGSASFFTALLSWMVREKLRTAALVCAVALVSLTGMRFLNPAPTADPMDGAPVVSASTIAADPRGALRLATRETAPNRMAISVTSAPDPQPSLTARELYERGEQHKREGRTEEALADMTSSIELLDQGIGRWEWFTDVYSTRASLFANKKDYAGANADYTRRLEFEPRDFGSRFNRALYSTFLGQPDAAIADYSAIIDDPDTDFSRNMETKEKLLAMTFEYRGRVYQDSKEYDKAIADFTASIRVDPSGGDGMIVYWRRALAYRALNQTDKAVEDANTLSQWALQWATSPDSKDSDRDRALTAARFGNEILQHNQPFQLEALAAAEAKAGDFNQAIADQKRAIKIFADNATEDQRWAMQARLDLYKAGKPLTKE